MNQTKAKLAVVDTEKLMEAMRELKRRGFCDHPNCLRPAQRVAWDDDGFKFAYCEGHVREMAPTLSKKYGKPLLWVRIMGKADSPEDRLRMVFEDVEFCERIERLNKKTSGEWLP